MTSLQHHDRNKPRAILLGKGSDWSLREVGAAICSSNVIAFLIVCTSRRPEMYSFPILHQIPRKYIIEYRETIYSGRRFQSQLEDTDGSVLTPETLTGERQLGLNGLCGRRLLYDDERCVLRDRQMN